MVAETMQFFTRFLRHPMRVGAIAPSSRHLARAMVEGLEVGPGQAVVEFGPGTGSFTSAIRTRLPDPAHYLGIEQDGKFTKIVRQRFNDLRFAEDSAEQAPKLVREAGLGEVAAIICGLPFASLPPRVQDGVVAAIDALLGPGGEFRTFQYAHAWPLPTAARYRRRMTALLGPPDRRGPIWLNVPPAFVLTWTKASPG